MKFNTLRNNLHTSPGPLNAEEVRLAVEGLLWGSQLGRIKANEWDSVDETKLKILQEETPCKTIMTCLCMVDSAVSSFEDGLWGKKEAKQMQDLASMFQSFLI